MPPDRRPPSRMRQPGLPAALATLAAIGAIVGVFLSWYSTNLGEATTVGRVSGWDATVMAKGVLALAVIWLLAAGLSVAEGFGSLQIDRRTVESLGWLVALCATLALLLVTYRLMRAPGPDPDFLSRDFGIYVTLGCSLAGIVCGTAMAAHRPMRRHRVARPHRGSGGRGGTRRV